MLNTSLFDVNTTSDSSLGKQRPTMISTTSGFNATLRTGQWTKEEEQYAAGLMDAFKAGEIDDIEEGTSLRKYLARKLFCSPKRISKKFEGTDYNGKQIYFKEGDISDQPTPQGLAIRAKLKHLEDEFLRSIEESSVNVGDLRSQMAAASRPRSDSHLSTSSLSRQGSQSLRTGALDTAAMSLSAASMSRNAATLERFSPNLGATSALAGRRADGILGPANQYSLPSDSPYLMSRMAQGLDPTTLNRFASGGPTSQAAALLQVSEPSSSMMGASLLERQMMMGNLNSFSMLQQQRLRLLTGGNASGFAGLGSLGGSLGGPLASVPSAGSLGALSQPSLDRGGLAQQLALMQRLTTSGMNPTEATFLAASQQVTANPNQEGAAALSHQTRLAMALAGQEEARARATEALKRSASGGDGPEGSNSAGQNVSDPPSNKRGKFN